MILALAAVVLNQPEWIEEFRPTEKPTVAVLCDDSASMDTRDVVPRPATDQPISRRESIAPLISPIRLASARPTNSKSSSQPFSTPQPGHGTNLYAPLADAPEKFKNLIGIVLASDGDWNEGQAPVSAASQLRLKNIPVLAVPVGSATRLPDIEVLSLDAPTFGVAGKSVRVPFTIDSSLPREYVTTVTLKASNGDQVDKEIRIAPMGRTSDWIVWKPKETGDYTLTLDVPPQQR